MAAPKRTKKQREYDLDEISRLYLQGWRQVAIVDYLAKNRPYTVTQAIISRDLKTIQERWQASSIRSFDEARAQELAKIDHLELTYWAMFEASKTPAVKQRVVKKIDGEITQSTQEAMKDGGDWRILQRVEWCIDRRCKLLGLDAPAKSEISGKDGGPIIISDLTDEQLKRLAAGEDIQVSE